MQLSRQLWNGVDSESEQWYEGEEEALYMGIEGLGEAESEGESAYLCGVWEFISGLGEIGNTAEVSDLLSYSFDFLGRTGGKNKGI